MSFLNTHALCYKGIVLKKIYILCVCVCVCVWGGGGGGANFNAYTDPSFAAYSRYIIHWTREINSYCIISIVCFHAGLS